jgi:hypothetical protein
MFKLVAIVNDDDSIYIDTLINYYKNGKVWDSFENHVDFSSHDVARGVLKNEINYSFKDAKGKEGVVYKENNGVEFGNLEFKVLDSNDNLIDGDSLDFEIPFGTERYTKMQDLSGVDVVDIQKLSIYDENENSVDIEPHLHYMSYVNQTGSFKVIEDGGAVIEFTADINVVSHTLGFTSRNHSTVFNEEFNEWDGSIITNTLFKNYHSEYISNIFNEKKRSFSFTAKNVPLEILNKIKLNDVLEIREQYYRIDSYDVNIIKNEIVLKLINAFNLDLI